MATPLPSSTHSKSDLFGHPRGLTYLFTVEMWERFSYYGMRALLVLYMVKHLFQPQAADAVIGFATLKAGFEALFGPLGVQPLASHVYGLYTGLVYLTPVLGGLIADRWLGQRRTVVLGAALMALGHFMMAHEPLFLFALFVLILGNGAFKPNISTQVGTLYAPGDPRRDRAFSIFYVGINLGAFLAPLVCGTLGEDYGWHYGFAAAGVGMTIGLVIYLFASPTLPPDVRTARIEAGDTRPFGRDEWRAIIALCVLFVPVTFFWATYEQAGNTIALWADRYADRSVFGLFTIPVTWFQAFNPFMIFAFTPFIIALWARQAMSGREPSTVAKMAYGCFYVAAANLIMVAAAVLGGRRHRELALAVRLFRRAHHRRTLHLADLAVAGHQGRAGARALDDDGRVARDELHRRLPRRLSRQLLVEHGQERLLHDDRDHRGVRRRRRAGGGAADLKKFDAAFI